MTEEQVNKHVEKTLGSMELKIKAHGTRGERQIQAPNVV